jgi:malonyl-CoA O-methyltransferase
MNHSFLNIDQGLDANIPTVFLPGWGFDGRTLQLLYPLPSWIYPETFLDPDTIEQNILQLVTECKIKRIRIIGWSLGAMLGLNFAASYPEMVASLTLVSLRPIWPKAEVTKLKVEFAENPEAFLKNFYRKCFLGDKQSLQMQSDCNGD